MYKFDHFISLIESADLLSEKVFLWVFSPSKKSPHVGISVQGKYYSLQLTGKQEDYPVAKLMTTIKRKRMEVLFIELKMDVLPAQLSQIFEGFVSCQVDMCSCTAPLFELFAIEKDKAILFDLLDKLKKESRINDVFQANISENFQGIPFYTFEDVKDNLLQLSH